jgi:Dos2-interacting transcription regulator of RNA-Pol-II
MSWQTLESEFAAWVESCQSVQSPDDSRIEALNREAREVFAASFDNEKSLAKLFQSLGPGLTGRLPGRIYALNIICGAIEGCQQKSELTLATASLLADFFLEQCGPAEEEDSWGEDYGEQIRDCAMKCLSSLLGCRIAVKPNPVTEIAQSCVFYCSSARTGVTRRYALPDDIDSNVPHSFRNSDVTNGLSTLPRSRRSLCFSLLQSAVIRLENIYGTIRPDQLANVATKMESEAVTFVTFACTCMHGESDPRCLMQLLILLHKIEEAFEPLFRAGKLPSFPIVTMFDAVAPYYPINFTPPPNDSHGITRKGLNDALMAVLRYSSYDRLLSSASTKSQDTMTSLSLGLALERLTPMDGDDSNVASSVSEKREALDDLVCILFPEGTTSSLYCLHDGSVQQLSNTLIITHHEAAVAVLLGGPDVDDDKLLADSCRSLVSRIASCLEAGKDKEMWTVFVKDSVSRMTEELGQRQQESRIAIAYLAALVTSGAPQTIRLVLDGTVEKLIHALDKYSTDEEEATLAAFGIGAFFSAAKVAVDKAQREGLVIRPHPVDSFCSKSFHALIRIFSETTASNSLRIASVYALDSVLRVSSATVYEDPEKLQVADFVSHLAADVLKATDMLDSEREATALDLAKACAEVVGGLLGKSMAHERFQGDAMSQDSVLRSEQVLSVLESSVLVDLLFRSRQAYKTGEHLRFDRIALARACSSSLASASSSIESLLHALKDSLSGQFDRQASVECARALSYVLRHGGEVAMRAFHELSAPGVTVHDVLQLLGDLDPRNAKDTVGERNITSLDLPPTGEEIQATQQMVSTYRVSALHNRTTTRTNTLRLGFADASYCLSSASGVLKLGPQRRGHEAIVASFKHIAPVVKRRYKQVVELVTAPRSGSRERQSPFSR